MLNLSASPRRTAQGWSSRSSRQSRSSLGSMLSGLPSSQAASGRTPPRRPKARRRCGNADVAGDRETETRARGDAVDGRDDRLAHLADRGDRGMVAAAELVTELEIAGLLDHGEAIGQVLTRRKRAAGAGDHDSAYRGVRCAIVERRIEGFGERLVECVQHIGPIKREHGDCAVAFNAERREARHLPLKLAFRLFTKASTPSFLSSVAKRR